jgi:TRAP-type transport system periplasmic protein
MNKDKWAAMSPEVQKAIQGVNTEFIEKWGRGWDKIDKEGSEFAVAQGVKTITLSPEEDAKWVAAVRPILDEYVTNMKGKNLPGEEALNFCQEELKKLQ